MLLTMLRLHELGWGAKGFLRKREAPAAVMSRQFRAKAAIARSDIVTMAKSISGYGLPMALVLIDRQFDKCEPGEHNGTFRGNCHAFVAARAALELFWRSDSFAASVEEKGNLLKKSRLDQIAQRGIDLKSGEIAGQFVRTAFQKGLIVETAGPKDEVVK